LTFAHNRRKHDLQRGQFTGEPVKCVVQLLFLGGVMAARQREIRLPAKAKACDICANAAFRISTLHRRCLHDVI
jgi:hypothetical protein